MVVNKSAFSYRDPNIFCSPATSLFIYIHLYKVLHTDLRSSWIVSMQSTTVLGLPPMATILSVDSGQHWEYTLICAPVFYKKYLL